LEYNLKKQTVTVFGSSIPLPNELEYKTAERLGNRLAEANLNVCTGGYQGIMDAVSKGAVESGSKAIGVTLDIYNAIPSKYLTEEIKCVNLFDRIKKLIEIGDAYIVLQGGTGTLVELAIVWEFLNKQIIDEKPFACHSSLWKEITSLMEKQIQRERRKIGLLKHFDDIDDCADFIISSLKI
jgi:uncharacterized protein (TIGR00730 family)